MSEDVLKTATTETTATEVDIGASTPTAAHAAKHVAHLLLLVKFSTSIGSSNGIVGGLNFLEFRFCTGVALVAVGVVLAGQFAEGTFDFALACVAVNTQHVVRIALCHRPSNKPPPHINPPMGERADGVLWPPSRLRSRYNEGVGGSVG